MTLKTASAQPGVDARGGSAGYEKLGYEKTTAHSWDTCMGGSLQEMRASLPI